MEIKNNDWKLFRQRLPQWQEAHMDRLNQEYRQILSAEGNASDKFWALEKRIREDKRSPGVKLQLSRSTMLQSLIMLLREGVITSDDLDGFTDEIRDSVAIICNMKLD